MLMPWSFTSKTIKESTTSFLSLGNKLRTWQLPWGMQTFHMLWISFSLLFELKYVLSISLTQVNTNSNRNTFVSIIYKCHRNWFNQCLCNHDQCMNIHNYKHKQYPATTTTTSTCILFRNAIQSKVISLYYLQIDNNRSLSPKVLGLAMDSQQIT